RWIGVQTQALGPSARGIGLSSQGGDPSLESSGVSARAADNYGASDHLRAEEASALVASDLASDRLCLRASVSGNVAGVDTGLRATRAAVTRRSAGETLSGERTDPGSIIGTLACQRRRSLPHTTWNIAAASNSDSWQRVGRGQGGLAGSGQDR